MKARACGELGAGEGGGVGDDGEHAPAEGLVGGPGQEGGVGSAGVGDEEAAQVGEGLVQERGFLGGVHHGDDSWMRGAGWSGGVWVEKQIPPLRGGMTTKRATGWGKRLRGWGEWGVRGGVRRFRREF